MIVHPDISPKQISRLNDDIWQISDWDYYQKDGMIYCPYYNFYNKSEPLSIINNSQLQSQNPIFSEESIGSMIKINDGLLYITGYISNTLVTFSTLKAYSKTTSTTDWEESSFSNKRGWPTSVTFHQDRMVIGGSKSLPNRLWLSKSSDLFNFDLGDGLDDEAIEFAILSDQVNAIKGVISSRHLLVLTTGAEWMVSGEPLTPSSVQLLRQTSIGIYPKRNIPLLQVDGAVIFVSRNGEQLRECLFADVEQAYLSKDLTLLSNNILKSPVDASFNPDINVLYFVLEDGTISCLTSYRTENVNAWSKLTTDGSFVSVCVSGDDTYFCINRDNKYCIEKFDPKLYLDSGIILNSPTPQKIWNNLERFNDKTISLVADGYNAGTVKVTNGSIELLEEAKELIIGYPYEHIIEPLPFMKEASVPYFPTAHRIIKSVFKILESNSFCVDMGKGYFNVPLRRMSDDKILDADPIKFTGDIKLHALGWIRDIKKTMWSIKSSEPGAFTLLSVVTDIKTKD